MRATHKGVVRVTLNAEDMTDSPNVILEEKTLTIKNVQPIHSGIWFAFFKASVLDEKTPTFVPIHMENIVVKETL